ncbi:hypothetical protein RHOFW510R12_09430 [Rhodanobacter sp. FW510-R12]|uniref:FAD-dependent oxidoreductase n=1 Tax=unclassified Rhodanobacter TaxID=2621553 RepID=UPI0007AA158F|nr:MULTISPECIES: FAD-dependent oxidoreductase [unclassified Rhodanobacter]KZC16217.1 hypothetical protein RHOFW104R8_00830 [Rhodanobacter sp. FW104-R8]KZC26405.1 hypothetical protein RhoFW510T8_02385 [Rhodanobacter sp. FW510-T8]KZC30260.1 hypothetical protein RhoFW510R10_02870 [Rhodanobacter sp. FW510-R10]
MSRRFDAIIVGAGQAGPPLANRLTRAGRSVALIERKLFGGTCVNTGCMPTKTLVASARAAHMARRAADFGVVLAGDLGLDQAGVATDARGYVTADDELRTSVPGIWALGDCNGRGAFTHIAYNDYEIVAANLLDGGQRRLSERVSGYALYIDPPLGRVGLNEAQARKRGRPFLVGKRPMGRVGRAVEKDETQGFMKVIVDAETKAILGAAILGVEGDEAIHGIIDMMSVNATATQLQRTVPIHPTVSELIPTLIAEAHAPDG